MHLFYLRHGEPIYNPNMLTPHGEEQAKALAKRLVNCDLTKIYSSPSNRAMQTAQPTCDALGMEKEILGFTDEHFAYRDFAMLRLDGSGKKCWMFVDPDRKPLLADSEMYKLGFEWYEHPMFEGTNVKNGYLRIAEETDKFLLSLGYDHIRGSGKYRIVKPNDDRIALFAHFGFGLAFLSHVLDIPYPHFTTHVDMCHSGMTVIEFKEVGEYAYPRLLTYSSDSHLYKEGVSRVYDDGQEHF